VASAVVVFGAVSTVLLCVPNFFKAPLPRTLAELVQDGRVRQMFWAIHAMVENSVGFAVLAWWIATALACRWRPEPSWIDRSGRVVGFLWIALLILRLHIRMNYLDV
jgi:hypothetical protein